MPGTTAPPEIELIIEDIGGGRGNPPPAGGDDGDNGGENDNRHRKQSPSPKRYSTAITIALVSILMFFMALASAFIVLRRGSDVWVTVHLPPILLANTLILLASSFTLEAARRRLSLADSSGFRKFWLLTTGLGILFVAGQLIAWRQLVSQGVYIAFRKFHQKTISLSTAAEITSYYWHFMDGLWVFLLALLYLGK